MSETAVSPAVPSPRVSPETVERRPCRDCRNGEPGTFSFYDRTVGYAYAPLCATHYLARASAQRPTGRATSPDQPAEQPLDAALDILLYGSAWVGQPAIADQVERPWWHRVRYLDWMPGFEWHGFSGHPYRQGWFSLRLAFGAGRDNVWLDVSVLGHGYNLQWEAGF